MGSQPSQINYISEGGVPEIEKNDRKGRYLPNRNKPFRRYYVTVPFFQIRVSLSKKTYNINQKKRKKHVTTLNK